MKNDRGEDLKCVGKGGSEWEYIKCAKRKKDLYRVCV